MSATPRMACSSGHAGSSRNSMIVARSFRTTGSGSPASATNAMPGWLAVRPMTDTPSTSCGTACRAREKLIRSMAARSASPDATIAIDFRCAPDRITSPSEMPCAACICAAKVRLPEKDPGSLITARCRAGSKSAGEDSPPLADVTRSESSDLDLKNHDTA
mgnify:CR=1 FL=1